MVLMDMEMPKSCKDCRINVYGRCGALRTSVLLEMANEERNDNCPIKAELPKNATNGDVIKAMFPNAGIYEHGSTISVNNEYNFNSTWWYSPWEGWK